MSEKTPLIGLICTFIGVVLSVFVYVDTSSKIIDPVDELKGNDIYLDDPWAGSKVKSFKKYIRSSHAVNCKNMHQFSHNKIEPNFSATALGNI